MRRGVGTAGGKLRVRHKDEAKGRGYTGGERARGNTGAEGLIRGGYRHQSFFSRSFQRIPRSSRSLRIGRDVVEDLRVRSMYLCGRSLHNNTL